MTPAEGSKGGTGIALYKGFVYAEMNDQIVRYAIGPDGLPSGKPQVVLSGMPLGGGHPMHPFAIDAQGRMFVDMGSATNSCQAQDRRAGVPGVFSAPSWFTTAPPALFTKIPGAADITRTLPVNVALGVFTSIGRTPAVTAYGIRKLICVGETK